MAGLNFSGRRRLPVVLQTEAAECGLACLAMIAGFHGHDIDLLTLRRKYPLSLKGATLANLMQVASRLEFAPRPLRLDLDHLSMLKLPAIVHWDMNHFVVLKSVRRDRLVVHDPARGEWHLTMEEFSAHFTGIALELLPTQSFKPITERNTLSPWKLWGKATGVKSILAQIFVFSLALELFAILMPFFMQLVVDQVVVSGDGDLLTVLGIGFLLLMLINVAVTALRSWVLLYLRTHLDFQMINNLFGHLIRLPLDFFQKRHVGDVVSRFTSLKTIQNTLTNDFIAAIVDGIMVFATLIVMFVYSRFLAVVVLAVVAAYAIARHLLYRPLRRATEEHLVRQAKTQSNFLETVRGAQSIRVFGCEVSRHGVYQNLLADALNAQVSVSKLSIAFSAINGLLFGVGNIAVIWIGARLVLAGHFSVGMLFAFVSYKGQFTNKTASLIEKYISYRMLALHGGRVADIALTDTEGDGDGLLALDFEPAGRLAVEALSFRYSESEPFVLENVNFQVVPGESVAIVGPSGSGKTTLVKVMLGLLRPSAGRISLDGIDIRRLGLGEYRKLTGAVMQEDQLFAGAISDNIAFFDPALDQRRVEQCARLAAVHAEIMAMPMAYNTLIGDMGTVLSGGQKQRVLLARALYRWPKMLFLDEATSHLDVARERLVNDAVDKLNMTRIIIAHRPETIGMADRVIDLSQPLAGHDRRASA
jgi:ATP-binding cassette subfamily B protein RaxB